MAEAGPAAAGPPAALSYRRAIGQFTTGVTVVTSMGDAGPVGLTASAVCSLSLDPPMLLVCFDRSSRTLRAVDRRRRLGVNVLADGQSAVADVFASKRGEGEKFAGLAWHAVEDVPILDGVVAWLVGRVDDLVSGGDHLIAVTTIERLDAPGGEPLLYHDGAYRRLA